MTAKPYSSRQVAERLGHDLDWFYRNRARLEAAGLPAPILPYGYPKWERSGLDAWIARHHPHAPKRPANDQGPSPVPANDERHRQELAAEYGSG